MESSVSALFKAQLQSNLGSLFSVSENIARNTIAIIIQQAFATKLNVLKVLGVNKSLHHEKASILQIVWSVSRDKLIRSAANPD